MKILQGDDVYLRRLAREDLSRTLPWINDEEIMVIMGVRGPRNREMQEDWFENLKTREDNIVFAICLNESNDHIGNVSLFDINYIDSNAGLTVFIGDEENRGSGFGTEAVELLLRYAFDYLNLHKVYCKTNAENPAVGLYKNIGFKQEGMLREQSYEYGEYVDKIKMGILAREFDHSC